MFKPCVSPLYLDQMRSTQPIVRTEATGERVIVDTDATTESAVLVSTSKSVLACILLPM